MPAQWKMCIRDSPYTVVGGVPARPIKERFDRDTVARLQQLCWWDWPVEKIRCCLPYLTRGELSELPLTGGL